MYLNCHSRFSLRYGTITTEGLVQLAKECQVEALALTDIHAVTGVYDFIRECGQAGIKPIVGMEFRCGNKLLYIGLAKNFVGFGELNSLLTGYNLGGIPLPAVAPELQNAFFIYPLSNPPKDLHENEYIGLRPDQVNKILRTEWMQRTQKMVILQPVTVTTKKEFNLHKILRCIDLNTILSKLTLEDHCNPLDKMIPVAQLESIYKDYPEIINNTRQILNDCNFTFDFKSPKNKKYYTGSREGDRLLIEDLTMKGMEKRYGQGNEIALTRVKSELKVIDNMNFAGYFLFTWDVIMESTRRGFMHIGRGSGANSIVSYCLGITDICPIELNLYFERFLNPKRTSAPDFDIDWSWKERDEILNYIFEKYGQDHVAFTGTIVEFKYRSIIREIGKVFGMAKEEMDVLTKSSLDTHDKNSVVRLVHEYGMILERFPNQLSMHSCGILISEEPLTNYTPLFVLQKGFAIVQFDMHVAEDIGFDKLDILSQRGIGHINDSVKLIQQNQGITVDIRNVTICKDEARANEFLREGKTIGCFYIESPAMRGLLRRLKCESYKVLVAASSVIRPGVAQSGMMREYVFRHNHPTEFQYYHPVFEEQLWETYGIMVYQEDVLKIAHHFAGLDLSDADVLRRAMSGKTRSSKEFDRLKERFFIGARGKSHSDQLATEVFRQIESFAGYSFCKAHSASYAVESYQSLYLKVYYPVEFMVAVINNFGGFYRTEIYFHEARMAGGNVLNPCVNKSEYLTTLYEKDIYIGFIHLDGLEEKITKLIPEERRKNGEYRSLEDFVNRIPIGIEGLQILVFIGAFRFTGKSKNELILQARMLLANFKPENRHGFLFKEPAKEFSLPQLDRSPFEDAFDELELLKFPVSFSPFDLLKTKYRGDIKVKDLIDLHKQTVKMVGYLVSIKQVPTKQGMMNFGTWIDVEGSYFDTAHFANNLVNYPFQGAGCYLLLGRVEVDFHFPTITIEKMAKLPFIPDPRYADDKDMKYKAHEHLKSDISTTHRAPYPMEKEIGLPRHKMNTTQ